MRPNNIKLLIFMLFVFAFTAILFSVGNSKLNLTENLQEARVQRINDTLLNLPILAHAVSVYDITQNKKIFGKNDDVPLPLASLAKVMTVTVALGEHSPQDIVSIPSEAISQAGDYGLFANEKWNIIDLAKLTLINSANDGAYTLTIDDPTFLQKMNVRAQKIGMHNATFLNFTGLDMEKKVSASASASDMNLLAAYASKAYPDVFAATVMQEINLTSLSGFKHNFKNTNVVLDKIPNLLFSKTGYTDIAGGNLTIIFKDKNGDELAVTVLGYTFDGRFTDMENIVNVLYNS